MKYGRTWTEKIEDLKEEWMKFSHDQFEDNGQLLLGMKELNQRRRDINMTEDQWVSVQMLSVIKKRKKIEKSIYQALRNVVKEGGEKVLENF